MRYSTEQTPHMAVRQVGLTGGVDLELTVSSQRGFAWTAELPVLERSYNLAVQRMTTGQYYYYAQPITNPSGGTGQGEWTFTTAMDVTFTMAVVPWYKLGAWLNCPVTAERLSS